MDAVYSMYDSIASHKIDIGKYFDEYHKMITGSEWLKGSHANGECSIANFMPSSLGEEELDMLADYCSIDKLKIPEEPEKYENRSQTHGGPSSFEVTKIPQGVQLATLKNLEEVYNTESVTTTRSFRKYAGEITVKYKTVESDGPFAIPGKDVIVYIRVYKPCNTQSTSLTERRIILSSMIAVIGSQTLEKIRDLIECISDLSIPKEISEYPDTPIGPAAKEIYKSGFFYIEGTFYNDFRSSTNEDNSRVIREWAKTHELGPFKTARMEEARVDSLSVRFGYPWVYQHQGNCEHLIVFSDARLLNNNDELALSAYPRIHRLKHRRCRYCMMCSVAVVKWIITDCDRIPHNPCYSCDECFKSYNYIDGKKVGNFKAYRYPDYPDLEENACAPICGKQESLQSKGKSERTKTKT